MRLGLTFFFLSCLLLPSLFMAPLSAQIPTTRLSDLQAPDGHVEAFAISPDGQFVVYRVDPDGTNADELFSVPIGGGPSIRLNEDLGEDQSVQTFEIDPTSSRVAFQVSGTKREFWISPITGGGATRLAAEADGVTNQFAFTSDGQAVIAKIFFFGSERPFGTLITLGRIPIDGSPVTDLLAANPLNVTSLSYTRFEVPITTSRVVFPVKDGNTPRHLYSVSIEGGSPTELSNVELSLLDHFEISADGSYVVFAAKPAGSNAIEIYGTPTAGGFTRSFGPLDAVLDFCFHPSLEEIFCDFGVSHDGSRVLFLRDGDLHSASTETGVTTNLTSGLGGSAQRFIIPADEDRVILFRGPGKFYLRQVDVLPIDGGPRVPLTSNFPDPRVNLFTLDDAGERLIMRMLLDESGGGEEIIYQAPLVGSPGTFLSPFSTFFGSAHLFTASNRLVYNSSEGVFTTDIAGTRSPLLVRPLPFSSVNRDTFDFTPDGDRLVYIAREDLDGPIELWSVELGSILFNDSFEDGDLSRWSSVFP